MSGARSGSSGVQEPAEPAQAVKLPAEPGRAKPPIIFAIDDDLGVLGAMARDLRREYGADYRIMRTDSGEKAFAMLENARLKGEQVALFLVDQRMPTISGLDFLRRAKELFPDAKRVLLTAYADSQASIQAINETRLDYYLMKPWDPPEERLYPVLTELLDDWRAAFRPSFTGLTVIGHRYSAASHEVKEFLGRNLVPFRWLDVEASEEAQQLLELATGGPRTLPVVLLPDGRPLLRPSVTEIAAAIGLATAPRLELYDLVIVGAGPAGLAAGVYAASEGLSTLLVESQAPGGQAGMSSMIENYLGFPAGLSGSELSRRAATQARRFGAEILTPSEAVGLARSGHYSVVQLAGGREVGGRALLVATGVSYRKLDAEGAERLAGRGLYYGAALTEALAVKGGHAVVIGGGNSAGQAALYLAQHARQVTLLVRGESIAHSMSQYLVAQLEETPNVEVRHRTVVTELKGERRLEAVSTLTRGPEQEGAAESFGVDAVFAFIGAEPRSAWLNGSVNLDEQGFITTGTALGANGRTPEGWSLKRQPFWLETSLPGVFAAGDVRQRSIKRIASAVGEGAMAVQFIHQYLAEA